MKKKVPDYNVAPTLEKIFTSAELICKNVLKNTVLVNLHVFLAILESKIPIIEDLLKNHQEQLNRIKLSIIAELTEKKHNKTKKSFVVSQEIHKSLALANELSEEFKIDYVSVEQYFLALIMNEEYDVLVNYFKKENIDVDEMQVQLIDLIVNSNTYELAEEENSSESVSPFNSSAIPNLQKYAINLNQLAFEGKFSKIHVDEKLINQISEVLCLKKKNNPILVGEAGVGKTALVEALACAIVQGKVCDFLAVKQIFSIDLTLLLAGTIYRGQFEDRLKGIINEATDNPNIILFIDEIHMIVGAGDRQGAMDVANILKPALSRGGITCIGATTPLEYNKYIVADAALSRRFREIKIEEPSKEKVKNLIRNVVKEFEDYHLFKCDPEMVDCLVDYADKYYSGRFPDKAFDLLDQVGSKVKIKQFQKTEKAIELAQKLRKNLTDKKIVSLDNLEKDDQQLLTELQIESAAIYKKAINSPRQVERKDILECVSDKTGIPLDFLNQNNFLKLENTKKVLNEEIIGQSEAISKLCEAMLRSQAGMTEANKPLCSFLFTGPVGVGKTLAAKELAKNMIGGESNIFVFDMSEYSDTNSASKLIGSAPGFIDSEKGGQLTSKVHRSPYSVIIFEDIHKAHVKIIDLLISILEEGYCVDSQGIKVNFSHTIIIFTTNVGANKILGSNQMGFGAKTTSYSYSKDDINSELKQSFNNDFLSRIDEIVIFNKLSKEDLNLIVKKQLICLSVKIAEKGVSINFPEKIEEFIAKKINFDTFGARQIKKTIQSEIETVIAAQILKNASKSLNFKLENNKLVSF